MLLDRLADHLVAGVAHAVVAGQPAALLREQRNLAVVQHDREAILVERRLFARAHHLVVAVVAVPLPLFPVEAHVVVHAPFATEVRLPLEAEIDVLRIVRGLHGDIDDAVLAGDRRRLGGAVLDQNIAEGLFITLMARHAALALRQRPGPFVGTADRPGAGGLSGIKQRDRFRRDFRPLGALRVGGAGWTSENGQQTQYGNAAWWSMHDHTP